MYDIGDIEMKLGDFEGHVYSQARPKWHKLRNGVYGLIAKLNRATETNRRLQRRCQLAESAALTTIEDCRRQGVSLGRRLAACGYIMIEDELKLASEMYPEKMKAVRSAYRTIRDSQLTGDIKCEGK